MTETPISLLRKLQNRVDDHSWREFHSLYAPLLQTWVRARGLAGSDADEVVQEIFVSLTKALPDFRHDRDRGRFRTWLWRVMHNAVVNRFRQQARSQQFINPGDLESLAIAADEPPSDRWIREERERVLACAMQQVQQRVEPRTWQCFALHILEGRPAAEVAAQLGVTRQQVYSYSSRILSLLRQKCREYLEELDAGD